MRFDLIVIGSGPGGFRAAIQAAKLGKKVALVERDKWGGGCAHTGTIPSKSLREAALAGRRVPFRAALERTRVVVREEAKVVRAQLERNGVELVQGAAKFLGPHEVAVGAKRIVADHFVIATGARPLRHKDFNFRLPGVCDSDSILRRKDLPKRLLVVGAGVIGCEYASIFARLGSRVTLADRRGDLLRAVDHEIIQSLREEFEESGIELRLACRIGAFQRAGAQLAAEIDGRIRRFDAALVCMGRTPNVEELNLAAAGVEVDERNAIRVDRADFRTTARHIHAVGDVIGAPALAATSAEQGRIAAARIFGLDTPGFPESFPYGIYTIPEISALGSLELELREKGVPYVVGRAPFRELARGMIAGSTRGFIKLLAHAENGRLLGIHVIGSGASELIHIGQAAMALGAHVEFFVSNVFNYPTFAEAYKVAALNAVNQLRAR